MTKTILSSVERQVGVKTIFSETKMDSFVDVFVGGGSVSMAILNKYPNIKVVMNDMDDLIYSFWDSLIQNREYTRLVSYINKYREPTVKDFLFLRKSLNRDGLKCGYKGFLAWFFNRTTFSGIFRSGPIGGLDQSGSYKIGCRYNPEKTKTILSQIRPELLNSKLVVYKKDFREILEKYKDDENALLYLDPPYMKQGHQLYRIFMEIDDYVEMSNMLKKCKCSWIVSHDDYKPFLELFDGWTDIRSIEGVAYTINSIEGKRKTELLITKR